MKYLRCNANSPISNFLFVRIQIMFTRPYCMIRWFSWIFYPGTATFNVSLTKLGWWGTYFLSFADWNLRIRYSVFDIHQQIKSFVTFMSQDDKIWHFWSFLNLVNVVWVQFLLQPHNTWHSWFPISWMVSMTPTPTGLQIWFKSWNFWLLSHWAWTSE